MFTIKNDQLVVAQLSFPVYEDIHALPQSPENNKQNIENVANGPT